MKPKLAKESYEAFRQIEAEIHYGGDTDSPEHLEVVKKHLGKLNKLLASTERDLVRGEKP